MKTTRLFSVLMAMCLSLGVYAVDWSTIAFLGDGAGGGKYTDKYKVEAVDGLNAVNIQKPGWAAEDGIYVTVPTGISNINVASAIEGAGAVLYLSAFTAQETSVTIKHAEGELTFLVYYADGTAGGAGGGVEYDVNFALASNGATATASSGNAAEALDDNVGGTRWESASEDPQWFLLDLGQARTFNTVQIVWEGAYGSSFTVDYSTDATTWTNFATITDQTLAGFPYEQLLEVPEAVTAQYVRFTGTKRGTGYGYSFWEFRVLNASTSILTSLTATAASELAKLGEQVGITVVAKDQNGKTMDGVSIDYTVSPADAGVVVDGKYQPAKAGSATITAKSGDIVAAPISIFTYEGENVALSADGSKVVAQSSGFNDASRAVDGNEGTEWQGCATNTTANDEAARTYDSWFVLDLGAFYNVNLVTITFEGACSQEYHLDFSADNTNWNLAYNYVGAAGVNGHTDMLYGDNLKNNTSVRFVRFYSTKAASEWGMKIFELKVFATLGEAPADDEKPVMVSASLVSNTFNSAVIAVEATDNVAIAKYNVKDEANAFSGSFAPIDGKITVTGLKPSTTYNLVITALDLVGNESEASKTVQVETPIHFTEPTVAAPVPDVAANLVKAVYSDTYGVTTLGFGEWGGGYTMTDKAVGTDNYKMLTAGAGTYFGLLFEGDKAINATSMKYIHMDIWAENDGEVRIVPIHGGAEYGKFVTLKGQQWNSIELVLATDYPEVTNWSNVYQTKLDNTAGNNYAIDNFYFYTDPIEDNEAPTAVTATLASASYTSVVLTCQAEDNSGVVSFDVYNGDTKVGTGGAESGKPASVTVNNLEAGKEHTLSVEAYDQNGNKAARVEVKVTTIALPAPAPAPTAAAADVWSIYSDAYTPAQAWIFGGWSQSTVPVEYSLAENNKAYLLQNFNYLGFEIAGNTPTDLSAYEYIHIDVYTTSDALNFQITPISAGPKEGVVTVATTPNAWTSIDLPLDGFGEYDKAQNIQVKVTGAADCFIDNLYFYKPAPVITYDLDGGKILPANNEELYALLKAYYPTYAEKGRSDQAEISGAATFFQDRTDKFMTDETSAYKWLGDYLLPYAEAAGKTLPLDNAGWRWGLRSFLEASDGVYPGLYTSFDCTEAGKPENWQAACADVTFNLPTSTTNLGYGYTWAFLLPSAVKEGYIFKGWKDAAGNVVTVIPANTTEGIYTAQWEEAPAGPTEMTLTPAEGTIVRDDMAPFIASVAFDVEGEYEVTWEVIDMMGNDVTEGATGLQIFYEDYDIIIRVSNDYVGNMLMVMATYGDLFAKGTYTIGAAAVVGPEGLSVYAESALEIESLGTLQLLAGFYPENATANVIWSSSDETLATVDQNGLVTSLYTATDKDTTVRIFAMAEGFEGVEGYADITLLKAEIPSALENATIEGKATKVLRNGTLIIIRDEEEYTILGTKIQ